MYVAALDWKIISPVKITPCSSGVAGPLSARGGGQICRPFVLVLETTLYSLYANTYETYNLNFYVIFFYNFRPFAARCGPHPLLRKRALGL